MKKTFKMTDVDCANCARKMQEALCRLDGVTACTISFLTQKMTLEADDARFDAIAKLAAKACKKIDDECEVELK